jgi:hypothetical protein
MKFIDKPMPLHKTYTENTIDNDNLLVEYTIEDKNVEKDNKVANAEENMINKADIEFTNSVQAYKNDAIVFIEPQKISIKTKIKESKQS